MISPHAVLEGTDWGNLGHAYGSAADAPGQLAGLLSKDPQTIATALGYLDAAILHQGTIYSATAPAMVFVAGVLADPRLAVEHAVVFPWDDRQRSTRTALLEWLGNVAESAAWGERERDDEDELEDGDAAALETCRAARRDVFDSVAPYLNEPDGQVRSAALGAVTYLLAAPDLADLVPTAAARISVASERAPMVQRAGIALALSSWGITPSALLADEYPAVRACAALAPALAADPAAFREIMTALADPAAADAWFAKEPPPQLDGWFRFTLLAAAIERAADFDELAPVVPAVVAMASMYAVDRDWGPLLVKAFPAPYVPGDPLTSSQRQFLTALVDRDACWGKVVNSRTWLAKAGLPNNRAALRDLLDAV